MIMCVPIRSLPTSERVLKDVDIDALLSEKAFFKAESEAFENGYVPVDFVTSIRTTYNNTVIQRDKKGTPSYYAGSNSSEYVKAEGYEIAMLLASLSIPVIMDNPVVMNNSDFRNLMLGNSAYNCIGLYNPAPMLYNPIIYSHIILADGAVKDFESYLGEKSKFVTLEHMRNNCEGSIHVLLDELIDVKEES